MLILSRNAIPLFFFSIGQREEYLCASVAECHAACAVYIGWAGEAWGTCEQQQQHAEQGAL